MSEFLIYGDPHIRYQRPVNRKEGFYEQLKAKLKEVKKIEKQIQPKVVFGLGDLFDNEASLFFNFLMYDLSEYIQGHISLIGNHDSKNKSVETRGTMLGVVQKHSVVSVPHEDLVLGNVLFRFGHYPIKDTISHECKFNGLKVMLMHDYILSSKETIGARGEFKEAKNIKTDFDIYLLGHYHFPFAENNLCEGITREKHKVLFYNPGSLLRLTTKEKDYNRIPKVAILKVNDEDASFKLTEINLECALDYKDVYDFEGVNKKKGLKSLESKFVDSIKENISNNYDREELILNHIKEVSKDKDVNDYVSRKIEQWKERK